MTSPSLLFNPRREKRPTPTAPPHRTLSPQPHRSLARLRACLPQLLSHSSSSSWLSRLLHHHRRPTMAFTNKPKNKVILTQSQSSLCITLFFIVLFTVPALFLLRTAITPASICNSLAGGGVHTRTFSGDLRGTVFAWNHLSFENDRPPSLPPLRIAVFSRKWPVGSTPGGMERHAYTLHTTLARRGHQIHVFTSPVDAGININQLASASEGAPHGTPQIHFHEGEPGKWRYNKAWEMFVEESQRKPFDVIHSESVALPHWLAKSVPNLAVSWHGIALESLQSDIYQDLALRPNGVPIPPDVEKGMQGVIPKVLNEIRFFKNYQHHVAISDSCGEMLRDVYQIPTKRVHVILNGVDERDFQENSTAGRDFRSKIGVPQNATVLGVAGRLVKDKGHPLLHEAFSIITKKHRDVYLVVAGSGPWANRYKELGPRVLVLGSMSPTQLGDFYNSIDVFLNPTLRPQGLDLTLMEAMMSGKPIMAPSYPSIKGTIVVDDELGFLFAPNVESILETVEVLVRDGRQRLAQRGRACRKYAASMFTATKMSLAYERLFYCIKNETLCKYPW